MREHFLPNLIALILPGSSVLPWGTGFHWDLVVLLSCPTENTEVHLVPCSCTQFSAWRAWEAPLHPLPAPAGTQSAWGHSPARCPLQPHRQEAENPPLKQTWAQALGPAFLATALSELILFSGPFFTCKIGTQKALPRVE